MANQTENGNFSGGSSLTLHVIAINLKKLKIGYK